MLSEEKKNRKRLIAELLSKHDDTFQVAYSGLQSEGIQHTTSREELQLQLNNVILERNNLLTEKEQWEIERLRLLEELEKMRNKELGCKSFLGKLFSPSPMENLHPRGFGNQISKSVSENLN